MNSSTTLPFLGHEGGVRGMQGLVLLLVLGTLQDENHVCLAVPKKNKLGIPQSTSNMSIHTPSK